MWSMNGSHWWKLGTCIHRGFPSSSLLFLLPFLFLYFIKEYMSTVFIKMSQNCYKKLEERKHSSKILLSKKSQHLNISLDLSLKTKGMEGGRKSFRKIGSYYAYYLWIPQWLSSKESACNAGDRVGVGLISGSGRYPGEGNGTSLQYSGLENSMDRGARWAIVHGSAKSQTQLSDWTGIGDVQWYSKKKSHLKMWKVSSARDNL